MKKVYILLIILFFITSCSSENYVDKDFPSTYNAQIGDITTQAQQSNNNDYISYSEAVYNLMFNIALDINYFDEEIYPWATYIEDAKCAFIELNNEKILLWFVSDFSTINMYAIFNDKTVITVNNYRIIKQFVEIINIDKYIDSENNELLVIHSRTLSVGENIESWRIFNFEINVTSEFYTKEVNGETHYYFDNTFNKNVSKDEFESAYVSAFEGLEIMQEINLIQVPSDYILDKSILNSFINSIF